MESAFDSIALPSTQPGVGYSLKHKLAVEALIRYYCKQAIGRVDGNGQTFTKDDYQVMINRGICHDMDKILMMLSYPQLTADYYHRMYNGHHVEGFVHDSSCKFDWIEMIFDWESARYTKPDKGKCAYEVATTFNSHLYSYVKPYLQLFGFTKVSSTCIKGIKDSVNRVLTEKDLNDAFLRYIHCTHLHRLENVSRIDQKAYYQFYGRPCPLRKTTVYCSRPTSYTNQSRSLSARELIQGGIEVNAFDMDTLCSIKVDEIPKLEGVIKNKILELGRMQR